jgi:Phosphate-starvation-inducible E family
MIEGALRSRFGDYLSKAEVVIYSVLAVLLSVTALVAMVSAARLLWDPLIHRTMGVETLRVLDQLLVVLMLVEILHTVRVSIHSHILVTEPFLVVGLIASIRRILVITLEASTLTNEGSWTTQGASIFRASMVELGLLGLLILILVFCITLLRRSTPAGEDSEDNVENAG